MFANKQRMSIRSIVRASSSRGNYLRCHVDSDLTSVPSYGTEISPRDEKHPRSTGSDNRTSEDPEAATRRPVRSTARVHWSKEISNKYLSTISCEQRPCVKLSDRTPSLRREWQESTWQAKTTSKTPIETTVKSIKIQETRWWQGQTVGDGQMYFTTWVKGPCENSMAQSVGHHPPTSLRGSLSLEATQILTMANMI